MQGCEQLKADTDISLLPKALVDRLWSELNELLDPTWIEFARLCDQLVYSDDAPPSNDSTFKDTLDAIFGDRAGCQRLLAMRVSLAMLILQRLIPNASHAPVLHR